MTWTCSKHFLLLSLSMLGRVSHGYTSQREVLTRNIEEEETLQNKMLRRNSDKIDVREEQIHYDDSSFSSSSFDRKPERKMMDEYEVRAVVRYSCQEGKDEVDIIATEILKSYENESTVIATLTYSALQTLRNMDCIESIEQDYEMDGLSTISEIFLGSASENSFLDDSHHRHLGWEDEKVPYGISMVEADQLEIGPSPPKVCLCDTGYAIDHFDLPKDVTGDSALNAYKNTEVWKWDSDVNGHGSHIAGVVAAISENGKGVRGVSTGIGLHITRGLSDESRAFESDILDAVEQCAAAGAKVISLSLGGGGMTERAKELYADLVQNRGIIIVAASGNNGKKQHSYPASHPDVISVAAVYAWGRYWEGSNYSPQVELAAPGYRILSTTVSNSAVHTDTFSYPAYQLQRSLRKDATGELVYCGDAENGCEDPKGLEGNGNFICMMLRTVKFSLSQLITICEEQGGVGAIIFSDGSVSGAWGAYTKIPAVALTEERGLELIQNFENKEVSIGYRIGDEPEYTYSYYTGTSMATPHVAAVAALVWSHFPQCTNHQIRYALAVSARDAGIDGCDWDYGYGIVQAKKAYNFLNEHGCEKSFGRLSRGGCTTA